MTLGVRVLAEFGDDPNRYADARSRKNYSGTSPITRASGKHHVVLARYARNKRFGDACYQWAFATLTASPGARAYYDQRRAAGDTPTEPYVPSATDSSGSSTAASDTATAMTNTPPGHTDRPTTTRRLTPTARGMSRCGRCSLQSDPQEPPCSSRARPRP
jgi:hypothetical protein